MGLLFPSFVKKWKHWESEQHEKVDGANQKGEPRGSPFFAFIFYESTFVLLPCKFHCHGLSVHYQNEAIISLRQCADEGFPFDFQFLFAACGQGF